ncbi:hypothetical protein HNGLIVSP_CDS0173 [Escherichia phage 241]|nr:hypothetical protein HNGLIVSP_CDS0173 [Escherichia phage 241]
MAISQTVDLKPFHLNNLPNVKLVLYKDPSNFCWVASCDTHNNRRAVWDFPPTDEGRVEAIRKLEFENLKRTA